MNSDSFDPTNKNIFWIELARHLNIPAQSEQEILDHLEKSIAEKLQKNPEKLWNDLYRLDVSESLAQKHFSDPRELAKAILSREIQKAKTRLLWAKK